jgi:hypothetical protein
VKGGLLGGAVATGSAISLLATGASGAVLLATAGLPPAAMTAALDGLLAVGGLAAVVLVLCLQLPVVRRRPPAALRVAGWAALVAWLAGLLVLAAPVVTQANAVTVRIAAGLGTLMTAGLVVHLAASPTRCLPSRPAYAAARLCLPAALAAGALVLLDATAPPAARTAAAAGLVPPAEVALLLVALDLTRVARRWRPLGRRLGRLTAWAAGLLCLSGLGLAAWLGLQVEPGPLRLAVGVVAAGALAPMVLAAVLGSMLVAWAADPG